MNLKIKTGESSKKNSLKIAFLLYFLISVQFVFAQNQTIDLNMTDKPLSEIFKSIEKQADISVDFDETQINIHQKISVNIKNKKLTYNPQNEMFQRFKTKCSFLQNEAYLCKSFFLP